MLVNSICCQKKIKYAVIGNASHGTTKLLIINAIKLNNPFARLFKRKDNAESLRICFLNLINEINQLHLRELFFQNNISSFIIDLFITEDMPFLYAILDIKITFII